RSRSAKIYACILLSLSDETLKGILPVPENNAYCLWKALLKKYESDTHINIMSLRSKLLTLKMDDSDTLEKFIIKIKTLKSELNDKGSSIPDEDLIHVLLHGTPKTDEYKIAATTILS